MRGVKNDSKVFLNLNGWKDGAAICWIRKAGAVSSFG